MSVVTLVKVITLKTAPAETLKKLPKSKAPITAEIGQLGMVLALLAFLIAAQQTS